jgi:beta-glucanase (GH16 family)
MATILNAKDVPLPKSETSVNWYSATNSGPQLYGSSQNDSMYGDASVDVTMYGGLGDDIYYLYSTKNRAVEQPGEGTDTISTWMSYTLPDNIENLTVTGSGQLAVGNSGDNIIKGGNGTQTLDGGQGDDVLRGGAGSDIFIAAKGNGSDLILDFLAEDTVRLDGYGFISFDAVKANMVQSGSDVRLDLGNGEELVFANKTIDQFEADQFKLGVDKSNMTLAFSDEFDTLNLWNGESGTWESNFPWGGENGSTLGGSELQWYIDTDYGPTKTVNPFSVENGVLTITAERAPDSIKSEINNYDYTSGILTTHKSFAQTYGYFEMRADMPDNDGAWPAFWLLPEDGSWPPELDVVEMRGQNPNTVIVTAHSNQTGSHTKVNYEVQVPDTEGFHTYGVLWTPEELVWYFDDVEVARTATPADMHEPMYMLANLAVGGMAGTPDDGLATPAELKIDYIHAYSLDDFAAAGAV